MLAGKRLAPPPRMQERPPPARRARGRVLPAHLMSISVWPSRATTLAHILCAALSIMCSSVHCGHPGRRRLWGKAKRAKRLYRRHIIDSSAGEGGRILRRPPHRGRPEEQCQITCLGRMQGGSPRRPRLIATPVAGEGGSPRDPPPRPHPDAEKESTDRPEEGGWPGRIGALDRSTWLQYTAYVAVRQVPSGHAHPCPAPTPRAGLSYVRARTVIARAPIQRGTNAVCCNPRSAIGPRGRAGDS